MPFSPTLSDLLGDPQKQYETPTPGELAASDALIASLQKSIADHPLNQGVAAEHHLNADEIAALHTSGHYRPGGTSDYAGNGWSQVDPLLATISGPPMDYLAANTSDANLLNLGVAPPVRLPPVDATSQPPMFGPPPTFGPQQQSFNIPGYSAAGIPQVQQPNPLISIAAALLGGGRGFSGTLYGASAVQQYQNAQAEHSALLSQRLYANSPADQMRKSQQGIYQSRMANDVNRYLDWIHKDVNATISPDERDRVWNQIRSNYAPLGIDPGPSPAQVEWQMQQDAAPELRNAGIVEKLRADYGDSTGDIAAGLLRSDPKDGYDKVLKHIEKMEHIKTLGLKASADIQKQQINDAKKKIEEYRKRDLEAYKGIGTNAKQLKKPYGSSMTTTTPAYGQGEMAIHSFYDAQQQALSSGKLSSVNQLFGPKYHPTDITDKMFPAFVNSLGNRVNPPAESVNRTSDSWHKSDAITFPAGTTTVPMLSDEQKAHAITIDSPEAVTQAKATANQNGRAILVRRKGQLYLLNPETGL